MAFSLLDILSIASQAADASRPQEEPLVVPAGAPLRLYLTKRIPKRVDAPVEAKVLEPVYAFDREVIPAGAVVLGRVSRLQAVSKMRRTQAILGGDFTPLHVAFIEFTTLVMPDGRKLPLRTAENVGLQSIVSLRPAKTGKASAPQNTGVLGTAKQQAKDMIQGQMSQVKSVPVNRVKTIADLVRGPDKKERIEDYLATKLPYHPQYIRKGTRFDAELLEPVSFGSAVVLPESLALVGTQPPADSVGHARLITPLDSASSHTGEPVEAVLSEPVYSADHKLILPEGTHLEGTLVHAKPARWFRRSGQLRFNFRNIDLPEDVARLQTTTAPVDTPVDAPESPRPVQKDLKIRTEASLEAAESPSKTALKVDSEGGVEAKEPKTRFLAAAAAVIVAGRAADNDAGRTQSGQIGGQSQNVGGRTLGGGFGFGLLGAAVAQSSKYVGTAFGYYGMAWTLYSTLVARGSEVQFGKSAMIDIRFNTRSAPAVAGHPASGTAPPASH